MTQIIPAILTDNPDELNMKLASLVGLTDWVQIDIMDGIFVPQTSIGLEELAGQKPPFKLDIHLMVNNPQQYLGGCRRAGAKRVIFHLEGAGNPETVLDQLGALGFERGIALRPQTSFRDLEPYLDHVDVILLMSVEPGKQGQTFIPETAERIHRLRQIAPRVKIEVDGGINADNILAVAEAGADYLAIGSAILNAPDVAAAIERLKAKLNTR